MAGPHYGLVLSPSAYNKKTGMCVVLIGTSKVQRKLKDEYGFCLDIPNGVLSPTAKNPSAEGILLCDAVRQIDWRERGASFVAESPKDFLYESLDILLSVVDSEEE